MLINYYPFNSLKYTYITVLTKCAALDFLLFIIQYLQLNRFHDYFVLYSSSLSFKSSASAEVFTLQQQLLLDHPF